MTASKTNKATLADLPVPPNTPNTLTTPRATAKRFVLDEENLVPDITILKGIFGDTLSKCPRFKVITNDVDACTFVVDLEGESKSPESFPTKLSIRIEAAQPNKQLFCSAAFQKIAHRRLPHLIPKIWGVGSTKASGGRELHYILSQHYQEDVVTVESIWEKLNNSAKRALMADVVSTMSDLQGIRLRELDKEDWDIPTENPLTSQDTEDMPAVGNSHVGWFKHIKSFLLEILDPGKAKYGLAADDEGSVVLSTNFSANGIPNPQNIEFTSDDLAILQHACVLCHNDIEPRNILVRLKCTDFGLGCELVAITNFDSAGFFPFAYETARKDTDLGKKNRHGDWYELYKDFTRLLLREHADRNFLKIEEKLIKAVVLADRGQRRSQAFNVGNRVQEKWLEREGFKRSDNARVGFVKSDVATRVFTQADDDKLEEEALKELGYI
ncbi:uncharacterized protein CTRU02_213094 [Colletotrichum truncatum]|uniref:Uncharacterized protein n=1 Tax=Colletotrichum truncatum TaxID=5467 RepID=A0ACC3YJQ7_COLTU|nr:uncharacterized protein CTRU02_03415 [Colletotrichum truncatum]KAF6797384.1 hypothetical protein CTRU02_03415 [Colletotrichum truncatum]